MKSELKLAVAAVAVIIAVILALFASCSMMHSNDIQEFQVIQSVTGETSIRAEGGYYFQMFSKVWTYFQQ